MIHHVVERYRVDEQRIFVTGLSAGGAMANVMLTTYPEVFAGGAIIADFLYERLLPCHSVRLHARTYPSPCILQSLLLFRIVSSGTMAVHLHLPCEPSMQRSSTQMRERSRSNGFWLSTS